MQRPPCPVDLAARRPLTSYKGTALSFQRQQPARRSPSLLVLSFSVPASLTPASLTSALLPCGSVFGDSRGWACLNSDKDEKVDDNLTRGGNGIQTIDEGPVLLQLTAGCFFPLQIFFDIETPEKIHEVFSGCLMCPGCIWVSCLDF